MRKENLFLWTIILSGIFLVTVVVSCKKEERAPSPAPGISDAKANTINKWLEDQKNKATGNRPQTIADLQKNLDFQHATNGALFDGETMTVIPIQGAFVTVNNKEHNPINYLLILFDKTGEIRKGNIVQYIRSTDSRLAQLSATFFHDYYNLGVDDFTGTLTFLSIADELLHEEKYSRGKLVSSSQVQLKPKAVSGGKVNIACYDVWWVTWYPNGTSTWEYLYSYCDDGSGGNGGEQPCKGPVTTNGRTLRTGCGGGSGPGGGDSEVEIARYKQWLLYAPADNSWQIYSYEYIKGKRYPGGTGGYFTSIHHNTSDCNGSGVIWGENSYDVSVTSTTASARVSGSYNFENNNYYINKNGSWAFSEIFP